MKIRRSKEEWVQLVLEQKYSGTSIPEFCRKKGIHPNLFYRKMKTSAEPGKFVKLPTPVIRNKAITITCGNISVYVPMPCGKDEIVLILKSMKEVDCAALS